LCSVLFARAPVLGLCFFVSVKVKLCTAFAPQRAHDEACIAMRVVHCDSRRRDIAGRSYSAARSAGVLPLDVDSVESAPTKDKTTQIRSQKRRVQNKTRFEEAGHRRLYTYILYIYSRTRGNGPTSSLSVYRYRYRYI